MKYTKKRFGDENEMLEYANRVSIKGKYLHSWNYDTLMQDICAVFVEHTNRNFLYKYVVDKEPITEEFDTTYTNDSYYFIYN